MDDDLGRGTVFYGILDYIQTKLPKIFILENVKGFTTHNKGQTMHNVLNLLRKVKNNRSEKAYHIHWKVLNTRDYGIPHSRPRWYCVGIRKDCSVEDSFAFPGRLECPAIDELLDGETKANLNSTTYQANSTMGRNIMAAHQRIKESGGNEHQPYVVDCDASRQKSNEMFNVSPCITRSRNRGHWLIHKNRRMSIHEMMRLQGINPRKFNQVVSDAVLGQQIGNSMSVNVIEILMIQALNAANLLRPSSMTNTKQDLTRWQSGRALTELKNEQQCLIHEQHGPPRARYSFSQGGRRLMIDSGASLHLANWKLLTEAEKLTVREMIEPICMTTGNGKIWAVNCVDMWINELQMYVEVCVSPIGTLDGPCVLSLGKLLRQTGGKFQWEGDSLPTITVNGSEVPCYLSNEVPFMYVHHKQDKQHIQHEPTINNPGGEASSSNLNLEPPVTPLEEQLHIPTHDKQFIKCISDV